MLFCLSYHAFSQIDVDADLKDWGDTSLRFEDKNNKLRYDYREDEDFLYIAIFKNFNAAKVRSGGVQLQFDTEKITDKSLTITFAYAIPTAEDPKKRLEAKDFIQVENLNGQSAAVIPVFNEHGISTAFRFMEDKSHLKDMRADGQIELSKIGRNKSIFKVEIAIPKSLLPTQKGEISLGICLRGMDIKKTGNALAHIYNGMMPPAAKTPYEEETNDSISFSEYFTKIVLE
ncbi:hypothetical protein M472_15285 [Sphingobacterium paucimobilis HER1398]|uniref:Carbohydrate-binding domain-containing protein n=2 Tax=Sphingobacterium TaxID=28453 RepID=U2HX71_9SPHI|nr:hypothetical protein M472_15285 [Sphingobacterium paucimobilis HER1398]